jgi:hypothetical protein
MYIKNNNVGSLHFSQRLNFVSAFTGVSADFQNLAVKLKKKYEWT